MMVSSILSSTRATIVQAANCSGTVPDGIRSPASAFASSGTSLNDSDCRRSRSRSVSRSSAVAVLALLYAPARFFGDFLRNVDLPGADVRYLGLTVGQYGSLVLAGIAIVATRHLRRGEP